MNGALFVKQSLIAGIILGLLAAVVLSRWLVFVHLIIVPTTGYWQLCR